MTQSLPLHRSFPAIADHRARILILGSMPGVKSLEQQQYYAHPRNAFWPTMSELFDINRTLDYDKRCQLLVAKHIAVWDVLQACQREGSLDQAIDSTSMVANDFKLFLQHHPDITKIVFNGAKAEQVFKQLVQATLTEQQKTIVRFRLPSTSPAHASSSFDDKLVIWRQALSI